MFIVLSSLFFAVYLWSISISFFKLRELNNALKSLVQYLNSATIVHSSYDAAGSQLNKKSNYQECLSNVLCKYPIISKYLGYYCDTLEYVASDMKNYTVAVKLYNGLAMKRNYLIEEFKSSLNPFCALKTLFSLPGTVLSWFGLPQKVSFSRLLNLLCWIVAYLFGLYGNEIKMLIDSILKNLSHT